MEQGNKETKIHLISQMILRKKLEVFIEEDKMHLLCSVFFKYQHHIFAKNIQQIIDIEIT